MPRITPAYIYRTLTALMFAAVAFGFELTQEQQAAVDFLIMSVLGIGVGKAVESQRKP